MKLRKMLCLLACVVLIASCASSTRTRFDGTWTEPGFNASSVKKVLIIGLSQNELERRMFETNLKQKLIADGFEAVSSLEGVSAAEAINQEVFERAFGNQNIDAVIVSRLVALDEDTRYVEGGTTLIPTARYVPGNMIGPYGYYNNFYGYYLQSYREIQTSGYLETTAVASIETNMYETANNTLIWSAVSRTIDPNGMLDAISSFDSALFDQLKRDGFF